MKDDKVFWNGLKALAQFALVIIFIVICVFAVLGVVKLGIELIF